jgi:hypothetical protein
MLNCWLLSFRLQLEHQAAGHSSRAWRRHSCWRSLAVPGAMLCSAWAVQRLGCAVPGLWHQGRHAGSGSGSSIQARLPDAGLLECISGWACSTCWTSKNGSCRLCRPNAARELRLAGGRALAALVQEPASLPAPSYWTASRHQVPAANLRTCARALPSILQLMPASLPALGRAASRCATLRLLKPVASPRRRSCNQLSVRARIYLSTPLEDHALLTLDVALDFSKIYV